MVWCGQLVVKVFDCSLKETSFSMVKQNLYCKITLAQVNNEKSRNLGTRRSRMNEEDRFNSCFYFGVKSEGDLLLQCQIVRANFNDPLLDSLMGEFTISIKESSPLLDGMQFKEIIYCEKKNIGSLNLSIKYQKEAENLNSKKLLDLIKILQDPTTGVEIKDRKWLGIKYNSCFIGKELVNWMIKNNYCATREDAVALGNKLLNDGVIEHVCKLHPFEDLHLFYQFKTDINDIQDNLLEEGIGLQAWVYKRAKRAPENYHKRYLQLDLKHLTISFSEKVSYSTKTRPTNSSRIPLNEVTFVTLTSCKTKKNAHTGIKLETPFRDWEFYIKNTDVLENFYSLLKLIIREQRPTGNFYIKAVRARNLAAIEQSIEKTNHASHCSVELIDWYQKPTGKAHETCHGIVWKENQFKYEFNEDHRGVLVVVKLNNHLIYGSCIIPFDGLLPNIPMKHWFPISLKGRITGAVEVELMIQYSNNIHFVSHKEELLELQMHSSSIKTGNIVRKQSILRNEIEEELVKHHQSGIIKLCYVYNPPTTVWPGTLTVEVRSVHNLGTIDHADAMKILLRYNEQHQRTTLTMSHNLRWHQAFSFEIPPLHTESDALSVQVEIEGKGTVGATYLLLRKLAYSKVEEVDCPLTKIPRAKLLHGNSVGLVFQQKNWRAKHPILLIPGFGGVAMKVESSPIHSWCGERLWCSITKLSKQLGKKAIVKLKSEHTDNQWIDHMALDKDGITDPPGIRVRPIDGLQGIDFLTNTKLASEVAAVFGPLISNLRCLGYDETNLVPFSYDWRLPPAYLEIRDQKLSELKTTIEKTVEKLQQKMVVVCHSMGNKLFKYFLSWLGKEAKSWCDKNIEMWFAVGAPWLGSVKAMRSLISGDCFSLDSFVTKEEAIVVARSSGSMGLLLPIGLKPFWGKLQPIYIHNRDEEENDDPEAIEPLDYLKNYLPDIYNIYNSWYAKDQHFLDMLTPPPVRKLHSVYGVNIDTEVSAYYKPDVSKQQRIHSIFKAKTFYKQTQQQGVSSKKGIIFETRDTEQLILEETQGIKACRSGDGTVPYASLNYPIQWRDSIPELLFTELESCPHTEQPNVEEFFSILVSSCCEHYADKLHLPNYSVVPKSIKSKKKPQSIKKSPIINDIIKNYSKEQLLDILADVTDENLLREIVVHLALKNPQVYDKLLENANPDPKSPTVLKTKPELEKGSFMSTSSLALMEKDHPLSNSLEEGRVKHKGKVAQSRTKRNASKKSSKLTQSQRNTPNSSDSSPAQSPPTRQKSRSTQPSPRNTPTLEEEDHKDTKRNVGGRSLSSAQLPKDHKKDKKFVSTPELEQM